MFLAATGDVGGVCRLSWKEDELKGVVSCTEERRPLDEEEPKRWTTCSLGLVNSSSSIDILLIISAVEITSMTEPSLFIIPRPLSAPSVVSLSSIAWLLSRSTFCSFASVPTQKKTKKPKLFSFLFFTNTNTRTQHKNTTKKEDGKVRTDRDGTSRKRKGEEDLLLDDLKKMKEEELMGKDVKTTKQKSTYCKTIKEHMDVLGRTVHLVNFDPAIEATSDSAYSIDIREIIDVNDVMDSENLGPNGGLIFCIE